MRCEKDLSKMVLLYKNPHNIKLFLTVTTTQVLQQQRLRAFHGTEISLMEYILPTYYYLKVMKEVHLL